MAIVFFAWLEVGGWPILLVWCVRIFLALQTYRYMLWILDAVLACHASALKVACVYLHARLIGKHFE